MRRTIVRLAGGVAFVLTSLSHAGPADNWTGSVRCELSGTATGYSHQETQTWTLTGAAPTKQGAFTIYPGTWSVTGQGSHDRTRNTNRRVAKWTANVAGVNAPVAIRTTPAGQLVPQLWHAQLSVHGGYTGTDQYINDGVPQPEGRLVATVYEWQPRMDEVGATVTQIKGSSTTEVKAQLGPMQPTEAQTTVTCSWAFGKGTAPALPPATLPPASNSPVTGTSPPTTTPPGATPPVTTSPAGTTPPGTTTPPTTTPPGTTTPPTTTPPGATTPPTATPPGTTTPTTTAPPGTTPPGSSTPPANTAKLLSASPASVEQGAFDTILTLTGQGTHWLQTKPVISVEPGVGYPVTDSQATSDTELMVAVAVQYSASPGPRTVTVTSGSEVVTLTNAFNITARTKPELLSVTPNRAKRGERNVLVRLTGKNTRWVQGKTRVQIAQPVDASKPGVPEPTPGITVVSTTVLSPESATALINVDENAVLGAYWFQVYDAAPADWLKILDGFTVEAASGGSTPAGASGGDRRIDLGTTLNSNPKVEPPATAVWEPNSTARYVVEVWNNGPGSADGAILTVPVSAGLSKTTLTCATDGGGQCPASLSAAQLESGVVIPGLPRFSKVRITFSAKVTAALADNVVVTSSVKAPAGKIDLFSNDDSSSRTAAILLRSTNSNGITSTSPRAPPAGIGGLPGAPSRGTSESICQLPGPVVDPPASSPKGAYLSWPHINGATYTVSRSDLGLLTPNPLTSDYFPASMRFSHSSPLYAAFTYRYTVTARYGGGCGSTQVSIVPPKPFVPVARWEWESPGDINVIWTLPPGLDPPMGDNTGFLVLGPGLPAEGHNEKSCQPWCQLSPQFYRTIRNLPPGEHIWIIAPYWDTAEGRSIDVSSGARVTAKIP